MNKLVVALGLLLSSSAFASGPAKGTQDGNRSRAAVLKAAGVQAGGKARVVALQTASRHDKDLPSLPNARISVVAHENDKGMQISYVKVANDGTAKKLSARQVGQIGLLTGPRAITAVKKENGRIDGAPQGSLSVTGLSKYGSSIVVTEDLKSTHPDWNNVRRFVSLDGHGRSSDTAD